MKIEFRKTDLTDAELLIDIYNSSFYKDYIKYGEFVIDHIISQYSPVLSATY